MMRIATITAGTVLFLAGTVPAAAPAKGKKEAQIKCANLIYAGTKSSVCFSDKFLKEYEPHLLWRYMTLLSGIIADGQKAGVFRADVPPSLAAGAIFGALDEVSLHRTLARRKKRTLKSDYIQTAEALSRLMVGGLSG